MQQREQASNMSHENSAPEKSSEGWARGAVPIAGAVLDRLSQVPPTNERQSQTPEARSRAIAARAARRAALVSTVLALPGPVTSLTWLPDLLAVWNIQSQMVADIAGAYGATAWLTRQQMLLCLFKHGTVRGVRDVLLRRASVGAARGQGTNLRWLRGAAGKLGIDVAGRAVAQTGARALPVVGALGVGGFAYFDTMQVARTTHAALGRRTQNAA